MPQTIDTLWPVARSNSATTSGSAGFRPLVLTTLISSALTLPAAASAAMIASPAATAVRAPVHYGASFDVHTPDAASIKSAVLIRAGAVTHAFGRIAAATRCV